MPAIGYVTRNNDGSFKSQLKTLSIRAEIENVVKSDRTADTQTHYSVVSEGVEMGASWSRRAEAQAANTCR